MRRRALLSFSNGDDGACERVSSLYVFLYIPCLVNRFGLFFPPLFALAFLSRCRMKQLAKCIGLYTYLQGLILVLSASVTNKVTDIAAIVIHVLPGRTITKRMDGSSTQVRDLLLLDDSLHPIKLSAWDEFTSNECEQIASNITQQPTIIMTKLRATKFNGCSLSTTPATNFIFDNNIPELHALQIWKETSRLKIEEICAHKEILLPSSTTPSSEIFEIVDINSLPSQQGNVWIKGKISADPLTQRPWYIACNKCNRSTIDDIGTTFNYLKCNADACIATPRCILRTEITDNSGTLQVPIFGSYA